jgi:hypothetical protein
MTLKRFSPQPKNITSSPRLPFSHFWDIEKKEAEGDTSTAEEDSSTAVDAPKSKEALAREALATALIVCGFSRIEALDILHNDTPSTRDVFQPWAHAVLSMSTELVSSPKEIRQILEQSLLVPGQIPHRSRSLRRQE